MPKKYSTKIKIGGKSITSQQKGSSRKRTASKSEKKGNNYYSFSSLNSDSKGSNRGKGRTGKSSFKASLSSRFAQGGSTTTRKKLAKIAYIFSAIVAVFFFFGILGGLAYMQALTRDLPDPERPFDNENFKAEASVIYDRNGVELYRLFSDENRDILRIPEGETLEDVITPELKWAFLAAEDIDFYNHPGFDFTAIVRCSLEFIRSGRANCGGSTITQQVVKLAALEDDTRSVDRKLRELVLALQLENTVRDKDKILLLYMNIAPQGGNMYGIQVGAQNYFGKDVTELTLEEAVVIASIPNNPNLFSPTRTTDPEASQSRLETRKNAILDNMVRYKDVINADVREMRERKAEREGRELTEEELEDFITEEKVAEAKEVELGYTESIENIKAPHFVFFARDMLTQRPYNDGETFTLQQINTGGYKIYTTLDYDMQQVALDVTQNVGYSQYGRTYGSSNAAMMTMVPKTGEVLTMVGSRCYNNSEQANCREESEAAGRKFDPQVNVLTRQRQPGSSIKPMVYYEAIRRGILSPGSQMADVPIEFGNYRPRNSDGGFIGINSARHMLAVSRNLPANIAIASFGPENFAETKKRMGYSINIDPSTYGPAAALGAQDVYAVEHATAFATFANGGKYVPHEAIKRIVDKDGTVVYELGNPDLDYRGEPEQVLDEKAVFLVNDMTNPRSINGANSPVKWRDGRDIAGKTGTSENNRDNWFAMYSPDFVTINWAGNNDNSRMAGGAFGSTNAEPWAREFMDRVGDSEYFRAKTSFERPGGISRGPICSTIEVNGEEREACEGGDDFYITDLKPPVYQTKQVVQVCSDQTDRLARDIDISTGNAEEREFTYMTMPVDSLQTFLDNYLRDKQGGNGAPTEQCNVNRSPDGNNPWAVINNPSVGSDLANTFNASIQGFSPSGSVTKMEIRLGSEVLRTVNSANFSGQLEIPAGTLSGAYDFIVVTTDANGRTGTSSIRVNVTGVNPGVSITQPSDGGTIAPAVPVEIRATHSGAITSMTISITDSDGDTVASGPMTADGGIFKYNWAVPVATGNYTINVTATSPVTTSATPVTVTVGP